MEEQNKDLIVKEDISVNVQPSKTQENVIQVSSLLKSYTPTLIYAQKLNFKGVPGKDVYNITAPFVSNGVEYIAGRVESTKSETDSKVMFFIHTAKPILGSEEQLNEGAIRKAKPAPAKT